MFKQLRVVLFIGMVSLAQAQFSIEHYGMPRRGFEFVHTEPGKQLMALERVHHRNFRQMRESHRPPLNDWGHGDALPTHAIAMGELNCQQFMNFGQEIPLHQRASVNQLHVQYVTVYDEQTGESYPVAQKGNDFVAYNPNIKNVKGLRFLTITVRHTGCVPVSNGCAAETVYSSSYKHSGNTESLSFIEMNLATKAYEEKCGFFRRIFNFWPFYYFF